MDNIIVFGASGHGSVILDCIKKEGKFNVVGFVDSNKKKGKYHCGYRILGSELDLPHLMKVYDVKGGIVAIGDNWIRSEMVKKIKRLVPEFKFISTVHPKAIVGMNVIIGHGTVIMPGVIVNANCEIGDFCILNTNSSLDHDSVMENFSSLAPRACVGGSVYIGQYTSICLGTNIIENVRIKEQTIVGAGSLVIHDIEKYVVAYGSPAKAVRKRSKGEPYLSRNTRKPGVPFMVKNV